MAKPNLTAERLRQSLNYDSLTGQFTWREKIARKIIVGKKAGCFSQGRFVVRIDSQMFLAHRLAWLYTYGKWPANQIDHIDGNQANNRIDNLRDVTQYMNMQNLHHPRKDSQLRFIGVAKNGRRWQAKIWVGKKFMCLGTYDSQELARAAYVSAKRIYHPGCTI